MYNKMFKPLDTDPILYFKMYSNYTEGRVDDCCAFILMPSGLQRDWVCLQSIQFAFNKCGDVLGINIIFLEMSRISTKRFEKRWKGCSS